MPAKKRKKQSRKTTQSQSQKVIVNIGSKSKPRKQSGRGGLPPPSHQHNLAPTFITAPQVDYTPILAMMQHHARPIVEQAPMPITQTPLSSSIIASNAEQMAGEAAIRRAGPTSDGFQTPPSQVRMRPRPSVRKTSKKEREAMGDEDYNAAFRFTQQEAADLADSRKRSTEIMRQSAQSSLVDTGRIAKKMGPSHDSGLYSIGTKDRKGRNVNKEFRRIIAEGDYVREQRIRADFFKKYPQGKKRPEK